MRNAAEPVRADKGPANSARVSTGGRAGRPGRPQSEAATLVCAVTAAVLLGVACGAWINARLASAAFAAPPAPSHLLPTAPAGMTTAAPSNDAKTASDVTREAEPAAGGDTSANDSDGASEAPWTRPSTRAEKGSGRPTAVAAKPAASEPGRSTKTRGEIPTTEVAEAKTKAARGQGCASPCALYASADSLTVRGDGAAALVVGGPGEAGRVTVTTPDWSNIAVLSEGRAEGSAWFRYSVRSVSKRAGVYSVRFTTPCGARNIRVTVVQP